VQLERVDADTTWLLHADFEALRSNDVGRELLHLGALQTQEISQTLMQELGVDLVSQVRSLTLCGPSLDRRAGVMLLDVDPSVEVSKFLEAPIAALDDAQSQTKDPSTALRVIADGDRERGFVAHRTRDARSVFIVGDDARTVLRAASVIDGFRASMRTSVVLQMLGPHLAEAGADCAPAQAPRWPFDNLPAAINDRVMITLAVAQMPTPKVEVESDPSRRLPAVARVQGVLARFGEIRDELQVPWIEADIELRMQDEQAAQDMDKLVRSLLNVFAAQLGKESPALPAGEAQVSRVSQQDSKREDKTALTTPGAAAQVLPTGLEVTRNGSSLRVRAKEKLEDALRGIESGEADGAFALIGSMTASKSPPAKTGDGEKTTDNK
jgi:hypothetical protein